MDVLDLFNLFSLAQKLLEHFLPKLQIHSKLKPLKSWGNGRGANQCYKKNAAARSPRVKFNVRGT